MAPFNEGRIPSSIIGNRLLKFSLGINKIIMIKIEKKKIGKKICDTLPITSNPPMTVKAARTVIEITMTLIGVCGKYTVNIKSA